MRFGPGVSTSLLNPSRIAGRDSRCTLFGPYLLVTFKWFGVSANDAFRSQSLTSYRSEWRPRTTEASPSEANSLRPMLIEPPIEILVPSVSDPGMQPAALKPA